MASGDVFSEDLDQAQARVRAQAQACEDWLRTVNASTAPHNQGHE